MRQLILLCTVFSILLSCSSQEVTGKTEAEVLFKEAQQLFDGERYLLATERLNLLKSQYPYSFYATHAELLLADISFKQESYVDSAAAYLLFRDLHPRHKRIKYVIFQTAESYYLQLPDSFDRDLSPAFEAIKYYQEIIDRYPADDLTEQARNKIKESKEMLRNKDRYIGDFYYKTDQFDAAIFRYKNILSRYPDKDLESHAKTRIILSYFELKKFKDCVDHFDQFKNGFSGNELKKIELTYERCKDSL